jgi:hypothetical protein
MDFRDDSDKFLGILINERMGNFDSWDWCQSLLEFRMIFKYGDPPLNLSSNGSLFCNGFV